MSYFVLVLSFENDWWQSYFHLNLQPKWVSHFGQTSDEPLTIEAGIENKADLGSCWGCQRSRESSTTGQPRGGSHHDFLSHVRGCHPLVAPGLAVGLGMSPSAVLSLQPLRMSLAVALEAVYNWSRERGRKDIETDHGKERVEEEEKEKKKKRKKRKKEWGGRNCPRVKSLLGGFF